MFFAILYEKVSFISFKGLSCVSGITQNEVLSSILKPDWFKSKVSSSHVADVTQVGMSSTALKHAKQACNVEEHCVYS